MSDKDFTRRRVNQEVVERTYTGSEIALLLMRDLRERAGVPDSMGVARTLVVADEKEAVKLQIKLALTVDYEAFTTKEEAA